jgi:F420-dependent oxidoreductase-like protein
MIEGQEGVSWAQWRALAEACERHGVPALFRSDHYLNLDGQHPERGSLDAWATVNALGAVTSRLRLGVLVSPASFRHPSVLAKLVVSADHVSGGRVELGIGAGWHEREHEAYGFPFLPTRVRIDVLEEQLQILMGHWGAQRFSFQGEHYTLSDLEAQPKPVQQPHPPLILGGIAAPRGAALAARFADEYNTTFPTLEEIRRRRAAIAEACERAGREPMPVSVMTGTVVGADADDLADRARRVAERIGTDGETLLRNPPSGWIVGTVEQAAEQLLAIREAGVSRVMCQQLVHDDLDTVALLGETLAPLVR